MAKNNMMTNLRWNKLQLYFKCFLLCTTILAGYSTGQENSKIQRYIGCYKDEAAKAMPFPRYPWKEMTLDVCRSWCLIDTEQTYMATEFKWECYCGDRYDMYGSLPENACNTPCGGNRSQTCGGDKALSVHTVCPVGYYGKNCTERCHFCKKGVCLRRDGICPAGGCVTGWKGPSCSEDEDECLSKPCKKANQKTCVNTRGSYYCTCDNGYVFSTDSKFCVDVDECITNNHPCETDHALGWCTNTVGSYKCECNQGYRLTYNNKCEDVNECSSGNHSCNQECINTPGSFSCACHDGYELMPDMRTCADIDECASDNAACEHGCNNTKGSFQCYCRSGFELNTTFACKDIDECLINRGGCSDVCNNTNGSYTCDCAVGYELMSDQHQCQDKNECSTSNGGCDHGCSNTVGSYECNCNTGFLLNNDRHKCDDVNECSNTSLHTCDKALGTCKNTDGSYECGCKDGYQFILNPTLKTSLPGENSSCVDIDECADELRDAKCGENQQCTNSFGSFICHCSEGFHQDENGGKCMANTSGLVIGLGVFTALLIVCIVVVIILVFLRARRNAGGRSYRADHIMTPPVIVETKLDSKPVAKMKPTLSPKAASSKDPLINEYTEDDAMTAIYANFTPPTTARSPTRILISDLPALIQRVRDMPEALSEEFKKLKENSGEPCNFAGQKELKPKNRFKNILPYDHNRVELKQLGKDPKTTYINASFVKGYKEDSRFIASHGPIQNTIEDFWRMIWEYNAYIIVMVTKCKEDLKMKCELYWPDDAQPMTLDNGLSIKLCSADHRTDHVQRKFTLSNASGDEIHDIVHLQYTAWPDHGVPHHSISLLSLRHKVRSLVKPGNSSPIVVHCSAGVGRTGTYIALDNLLEEAEDKGEIDIHNTVLSLRKQRMNCVQTLDQYTFIFKALYEGLIMGVTRIPSQQISSKVRDLKSAHRITGKSVVESEFNMIQEMQPLYNNDQCSDALTHSNKKKNRNSAVVPPNCQRVFVSSGNGSDYINAVFVSSPQKQDCYIATQFPLKSTVGDFWAMCLEYNCTVVVVLSKEGQDDDVLIEMLPQSGVWSRYGKLSVGDTQLVQQLGAREADSNHKRPAAESCWDIYNVTIKQGAADQENCIYENTKQSQPHELEDDKGAVNVRVLVASLPQSLAAVDESLLRISREVNSLMNQEEAPVVVTCRTGISLCGPYIAASNCAAMLQADDVVDVVQIVLDLKKAQPHFIRTQHDYEQVYGIAEICANQNSTYANLL